MPTFTRWQSGDQITSDHLNSVYDALDAVLDAVAVSVVDNGAVGNGTTDDTAAIQATITLVSSRGGGTVLFPIGSYLCGGLSIPSNVRLFGHGGASKLIQRSDTESVIGIMGTESTTCDVGAFDVTVNSVAINIANYQSNLAPGDLVVLYDAFIYDPNGTTTSSGEILEVASATTNTLNLRQQVRGAFTTNKAYQRANGAAIHKLNMVSGVTIQGLGFQGRLTATVPIINAYYIRNARFVDLTCFQGGDNFLSMKLAKNVTVDRLFIENLVDDLANNHIGYGVHVSNAADGIAISNVVASNVRHAVTTTGGGKGIPRNISITNCVVSGCNIAAGIDTHAAADNITISNCTVTSCAIGITIRGKNVTVTGNNIRQCATGIRVAETIVENAVIRGNTIEAATVGIDSSDACSLVTIDNNTIHGFTLLGIRVLAAIQYLFVTDNLLSQGQAGGMDFISTCTRVLIDGNRFYDLGRNGAGTDFAINSTTGSGGVGRIDIIDNKFVQIGASMARAVNVLRGVATTNTMLGAALYTSSTKWSVNGTNQTGNTEVA